MISTRAVWWYQWLIEGLVGGLSGGSLGGYLPSLPPSLEAATPSLLSALAFFFGGERGGGEPHDLENNGKVNPLTLIRLGGV